MRDSSMRGSSGQLAGRAWPDRIAGRRQPVMGAGRLTLTASAVMLLARRTRYAETEMLGLPALVGPGSVCIDVGAAAGLYTVALSRLAGQSGQVHSIEPVPFAHPVWTRVLRAQASQNVQHHAVALGVEPARANMSVPVGRYGPVTGRSFLDWKCYGLGSNAEFAGQIEVEVEVKTLDGLAAQAGLTRLDFIKIDVEGAELQVLEGGHQAIEAFRPAMLIEIEARHTARYQHSPEDIADWLTQRGYTMHAWEHGWQETGCVCAHARNYLFLPPRRAEPAGLASLAAAAAAC
jgi:FkbM family methyltransferase